MFVRPNSRSHSKKYMLPISHWPLHKFYRYGIKRLSGASSCSLSRNVKCRLTLMISLKQRLIIYFFTSSLLFANVDIHDPRGGGVRELMSQYKSYTSVMQTIC